MSNSRVLSEEMCDLCDKLKASNEYNRLLVKMQESDLLRLEHTKAALSDFSSLIAYSTIKYPKLLVKPMFEPKVAFATPIIYFQNLLVDGEKLPQNFSHGATRSIFFLGERLMLLSKSTTTYEGKEIFSSFLLAHFEPQEYEVIFVGDRISISANCTKKAEDLLNGGVKDITIEFAFVQEPLEGKLMRKDEALASTLFTNQFKRVGLDAKRWLTSTEYMFEYVSSVPHFSPHPYMLQLLSYLGYQSQTDFQMHSLDYFRAHLSSKLRTL